MTTPSVSRRREFLDAILSFGFVSTAFAVVYPVSRYLVPPASGEPTTTSVVAARRTDLHLNEGRIFKFGSRPGLLVMDSQGDIKAFDAVCTHLGCTVQYKPDTSQLWCACHNGFYDLSGNVTSGPPPRPLARLSVHLRGEGPEQQVIVSKS
jgi:Rieske Fe-S protein